MGENSALRWIRQNLPLSLRIEEPLRILEGSNVKLGKRGETAMEMQVLTKDGAVYHQSMDFPTGSSENPLTQEENMARFRNCVSYGRKSLNPKNIGKLISFVNELEEIEDIRSLIPLLLHPTG
jgi:hypothetical protein